MRKQFFILLTVVLLLLTGCSGTMPKLGINDGQLAPCPNTPNCVSSQATEKQQFIEPILFSGAQQEAKASLIDVLSKEARVAIVENQDDYIRVDFTSKWFRFVDDVEFYFPATTNEGTIIHVRSASRTGRSDFGVNRKRIERIRLVMSASK